MSSTLREDARRVVWWVLVGAAAGALGVAMLGAIHGVLCAAARGAIPPRLRLPLRMLSPHSRACQIVRGDGVDRVIGQALGAGSGATRANSPRVRFEDRLHRGIERLTIVRAIRMVAGVALSLAFVAAVLVWLVDSGIGNFRDALWWAVVTVTTVGYGDVVPETSGGRLIGAVLMLAGVSAIPIATSLVVSVFVARMQAEQHQRDAAEREELVARLERIEQALARRD